MSALNNKEYVDAHHSRRPQWTYTNQTRFDGRPVRIDKATEKSSGGNDGGYHGRGGYNSRAGYNAPRNYDEN